MSVGSVATRPPVSPTSAAHQKALTKEVTKAITHLLLHYDVGIDKLQLGRDNMSAAAAAKLLPSKGPSLQAYKDALATTHSTEGSAQIYRFETKDIVSGSKDKTTFYIVREQDTDGSINDTLTLFDKNGKKLASGYSDSVGSNYFWK